MSMRRHILPLVFGILVVLAAGLGVMIFAKDLSDDAVATLTAAALGILGTHIGHVSGHELGRASKQ